MHATSCVLATKKFQMGRLEAQQVIQRLLDHLGIKAPTLARELDVLYRRVYDIQSGKTKKVSGDLAKKIVARYPDVSLSWLLTGEGDMLTGATTQTGGHHSVQMRGVSARGNVSVHTANERLRTLQKVLGYTSQQAFADALGIKQGSKYDKYRDKNSI